MRFVLIFALLLNIGLTSPVQAQQHNDTTPDNEQPSSNNSPSTHPPTTSPQITVDVTVLDDSQADDAATQEQLTDQAVVEEFDEALKENPRVAMGVTEIVPDTDAGAVTELDHLREHLNTALNNATGTAVHISSELQKFPAKAAKWAASHKGVTVIARFTANGLMAGISCAVLKGFPWGPSALDGLVMGTLSGLVQQYSDTYTRWLGDAGHLKRVGINVALEAPFVAFPIAAVDLIYKSLHLIPFNILLVENIVLATAVGTGFQLPIDSAISIIRKRDLAKYPGDDPESVRARTKIIHRTDFLILVNSVGSNFLALAQALGFGSHALSALNLTIPLDKLAPILAKMGVAIPLVSLHVAGLTVAMIGGSLILYAHATGILNLRQIADALVRFIKTLPNRARDFADARTKKSEEFLRKNSCRGTLGLL